MPVKSIRNNKTGPLLALVAALALVALVLQAGCTGSARRAKWLVQNARIAPLDYA